MPSKSEERLALTLHGQPTTMQRIRMVALLSWPAIMAQLSTILMEYIDASMVGSLGANASASIGLVATTLWLFFGVAGAFSTGYSVQVAHQVGAANDDAARDIARQSIVVIFLFALVIGAIGVGISGYLPRWLGGGEEINSGASRYFLVVMCSYPFVCLTYLMSGLLRCSGNMVVPGLLNVLMCLLDVCFNYFLIFDSHEVLGVTLPGAGLGVMGAALGTALAEACTGGFLMWYMLRRSPHLNQRGKGFSLKIKLDTLRKALKISIPMGAERIIMTSAQIVITIIVAPLGAVAIAANSFGITAESLCYMPGYGIADAATTLVGQSLGAGRKDLARSFGKITVSLGIAVMTIMGAVMWLGAPFMMSLFTPDLAVRALGVEALRIEAWAEPMFAAAIVAYGVMVGAGYTVVPACINFGSIWTVRVTLCAFFAPLWGLAGVWLAMCIELCIRGLAYLAVLARGCWIKKANVMPEPEVQEIDNNPTPFEL